MIVKTPRWAATQMAAAFVGLGVFDWWVDWAPVVELGVCLAGTAVALKFIHPEKLRVDPPTWRSRSEGNLESFAPPRSPHFKSRHTGWLNHSCS